MASRPLLLAFQNHISRHLRTRSLQVRAVRLSQTSRSRNSSQSHFHSGSWKYVGIVAVFASATGVSLNWFEKRKERNLDLFLPTLRAADKEGGDKVAKVPLRERRYEDFASVKFLGESYMTPRDFLESITRDVPRSFEPTFIEEYSLNKMVRGTPSRSKGSPHLFRDIWNEGILTYADYLFLLTALIKTKHQFEIAFNMIDADTSDFIDLKEFEKVQQSVSQQRDHALIQQQLSQSSLTVHLFGAKGNQKLYSKDFYKFIDDLQTEVLQIEFNQYSSGTPTICAEDFACILLKHTASDIDEVARRLQKRCRSETGITFDQFRDFCQLLNSLDDFETAMAMYTIAGKSVTEDEFCRAARVCIGKPLDKSVVTIVFHIFDVDGDGKLSHHEFLSVMKNWKLRGFKIREHKNLGAWDEFKTCIKMEMKQR